MSVRVVVVKSVKLPTEYRYTATSVLWVRFPTYNHDPPFWTEDDDEEQDNEHSTLKNQISEQIAGRQNESKYTESSRKTVANPHNFV